MVGVGRDELVRLGLLGNLGDDGRPGVVVGELVCKIPIKSRTRFVSNSRLSLSKGKRAEGKGGKKTNSSIHTRYIGQSSRPEP